MTAKKCGAVGAAPRNEAKQERAPKGTASIASGDRGVVDRVALRKALAVGLDAHWLKPAVAGDPLSGKQPARAYQHRNAHGPADEERLWAQRQPDYGLGVRTGRNGIVVIDVDWPADPAAREAVRAELARLLAHDGATLPLPTVLSGGGGAHWHVRLPAGMAAPAGRVLWEGAGEHEEIRLIGAGGNAVLPPSQHWSGARYTWGDGDQVDATPALLEALQREARDGPTDEDAAALVAEPLAFDALPAELRQQLQQAGAAEDRSKGIYRAVCLLRERGYRAEQTLWLVTESGLPFCSKAGALGTHWAAREVLRIWGKGFDKQHAAAARDFSSAARAQQARGGWVLTKASDVMKNSKGSTYSTALGVACPVGVVMLAGLGGTGKSTIAATLAAHVTNGKPCSPWEGKATKRAPAGVLWLTTEEDRDRIVLPRHAALGGDMDLLFVPTIETELDDDGRPRALTFDVEQDLRPLLEQAQAAGTPVRLVVCDTLPALVNWDGRTANSDTDVKSLVAALGAIAREFDCCLLGVSHLNKKADVGDEFRMAGAQAWRESPRMSFLCKAGFVYVNKANDLPEVGVGYEQQPVAVLYEIEAETESGGPMQVTARRAAFGPVLLAKPKVLELVALAVASQKQGQRDAKPKRIDGLVAAGAAYLEGAELLGIERFEAGAFWRAVKLGYGSAPNSVEKPEVLRRLGLEGTRAGAQHLLERSAA